MCACAQNLHIYENNKMLKWILLYNVSIYQQHSFFVDLDISLLVIYLLFLVRFVVFTDHISHEVTAISEPIAKCIRSVPTRCRPILLNDPHIGTLRISRQFAADMSAAVHGTSV